MSEGMGVIQIIHNYVEEDIAIGIPTQCECGRLVWAVAICGNYDNWEQFVDEVIMARERVKLERKAYELQKAQETEQFVDIAEEIINSGRM